MAVNRRFMEGLEPADVFRVLADGETYGYWVVGTRKVREISGNWPQPGSAIHYVVGYLPLRKDDVTIAVEYEPGSRLKLEAHAWPIGALHIEITVLRSPKGCTVVIDERPKKGLLKRIDNPVIEGAIKLRNVETLRRLEAKVRERALHPAA